MATHCWRLEKLSAIIRQRSARKEHSSLKQCVVVVKYQWRSIESIKNVPTQVVGQKSSTRSRIRKNSAVFPVASPGRILTNSATAKRACEFRSADINGQFKTGECRLADDHVRLSGPNSENHFMSVQRLSDQSRVGKVALNSGSALRALLDSIAHIR